MPRIAKADVHAALARAADHIRSAAGQDGVASRKDIKAKLGQLKGTEQQLVDMFFRFIDHRDAAPGARITKSDIDRALDYAKDKLIDAYDLNHNGLSKNEIADMSRIGNLAVQLARELKAQPPTGRGPDALSDELKKAVTDGYLSIEWKNGSVISAKVSGDYDNQGLTPTDQLKQLLALPEAGTMETLRLGLMNDSSEGYDAALRALAEAGPHENLHDLTIGDFEYPDQSEISWVSVGDISAALDAAPNLESLHVRGGGVEVDDLSHPHLKSLTFESGGLPGGVLEALSRAQLPELTSLEVWFGAEEYGSTGNVTMLGGLMAGDGLTKLRALGLKNGEFQNDVVRALADAPLLSRLEQLDLSMGTMTDDGAQAILDHADRFRHLRSLDLSDNFVSRDMETRLTAAVGNQVVVGEPKDDWAGDPDNLYVSVGE